jgi:hypothetical protein
MYSPSHTSNQIVFIMFMTSYMCNCGTPQGRTVTDHDHVTMMASELKPSHQHKHSRKLNNYVVTL